jgi:hypothetical protein
VIGCEPRVKRSKEVIEPSKRYRTAHAEMAAYLLATGTVRLVGTEMNDGLVEFIWDIDKEQGQEHEREFRLTASLPVAKLFSSFREIRNMIHQQRDSNKRFQGALNNAISNSAPVSAR